MMTTLKIKTLKAPHIELIRNKRLQFISVCKQHSPTLTTRHELKQDGFGLFLEKEEAVYFNKVRLETGMNIIVIPPTMPESS